MKLHDAKVKLWGIILIILLFIFAATAFPIPRRDKVIQLSNNKIVSVPYTAEVIYSHILRKGDKSVLLLNLEPQQEVAYQSQPFDDLIIESELELPEADVLPPGHISQPLIHGKGLAYKWQVIPRRSGQLKGTLWVAVIQEGPNGGGIQRSPFLAIPLDMTEYSLFGIPSPWVRWLAGGGLIIWLAVLVWKNKILK